MRPSYVYLVEAEQGLVKIGWSENPSGRALTIRTHSPLKTRLIAQWPATKSDEASLHKQFSAFRYHSEWFSVTGELALFVESNRGRGIPDPIPTWGDVCVSFTKTAAEKRSASLKAVWANPEYRKERLAEIKEQAAHRRYLKANGLTHEQWFRAKNAELCNEDVE